MAATNAQVQTWSDQRVRVRAEAVRELLVSMEDDNASIGEVYANLTNSPDWTDGRTDGPPSLLSPSDLLAFNTISDQLAKVLRGSLSTDQQKIDAVNNISAQLPIVYKACVRPVGI